MWLLSLSAVTITFGSNPSNGFHITDGYRDRPNESDEDGSVPAAHSQQQQHPLEDCSATALTMQQLQGDACKNSEEGFVKLVDWVRSNGGRVDSRLGLGIIHDGDNNNNDDNDTAAAAVDAVVVARGGIALDDIAAGTELLFCPWKLVLGTEGDTSKVSGDHCQVLKTYADEVRAGKDSFWYPYLMMDESLNTRIPSLWSDSALQELQGLPPYAKTQSGPSLTSWYAETCAPSGKSSFDQLDHACRQSLLAAITRSAGMRFLPIFDLLNHHNGKLNTRSMATLEGNQIFALVDIPKGSEIFLSYRGQRETSSDIFLKYGFIESWPQQWAWFDDDEPGTHSKEQRFLLLPNGSVAIYPPESMTLPIGSSTPPLPLADLQSNAERHNMQLDLSELIQFQDSCQRLLTSLPTTSDADESILLELEQVLIEAAADAVKAASKEMTVADVGHDNNNNSNHHGIIAVVTLQDRICAVRYRIHVKKAIQTALDVANHILDRRK